MKSQNTTKLSKKTVFIYKSAKDQSNLPTTGATFDQSHTVITHATFGIGL